MHVHLKLKNITAPLILSIGWMIFFFIENYKITNLFLSVFFLLMHISILGMRNKIDRKYKQT
jgi:hypothetical protein